MWMCRRLVKAADKTLQAWLHDFAVRLVLSLQARIAALSFVSGSYLIETVLRCRQSKIKPAVSRALSARDTLIYSEKSVLPKAKSSKINTLDSRLRGNDDFFSVSLARLRH